MGGCASKPKDLDTETMPAPNPVEAPEAPVEAPAVPEAETVAQEAKDGDEKKEEPLMDLSEPAPEAPKAEEATTGEDKPAVIEAIMAETELTEAKVEAVEEAKEVPKEEAKEVVATA